jgi:phosphoribosyl 1,2-cyclic phosphodiesterase
VLGSGSRGNAIAFTAESSTIVVDAGFGLQALKRRASRGCVDLSRLLGVIVTHEHGDHACGAGRLAAAAHCPLYASRGTIQGLTEVRGVPFRPIAHLETFSVGPFEITACATVHDAAEPLALAIAGPDGEKVAVAYDLGRSTSVLRYLLRSADCLIVESNHDEGMLGQSPYPPSVRRRIGGPEGHLSNRAAAELLVEVCHPDLATIVLAHVSEVCNRRDLADEAARTALAVRRFDGDLLVAEQDEVLEPFEVLRA